MSADPRPIASPLPLTNGKVRLLTLGDLDGRTLAAQAARALIADLAYTALTKLQLRLLTALGLERRMNAVESLTPRVITVNRIIVDPKAPDEELPTADAAPPPCPVGLPG